MILYCTTLGFAKAYRSLGLLYIQVGRQGWGFNYPD